MDIAEQNLPLLDEPMTPAMGQYSKEHTKAWAQKGWAFCSTRSSPGPKH